MSNTKTIELSESVLRALAEGIDRLNDGDLDDRAAADEAQKALVLQAGLLASNGRCYPASDTTSGYLKGGTYTFLMADGEWSNPTEPGATLYLDEDCTVPLRTV